MMVLGALVVFTIIIYFVASHIAGKTQVVWANEERAAAVDDRIAPVGGVGNRRPDARRTCGPGAGCTRRRTRPETATPTPAFGAPADTAAAAPAASTAATAPSGEETYNNTCFACHAVGVAGAPKLGDKADWGPRIAQGRDTLVQHAINGYQGSKGVMPPKGGRTDFSDEAVAAAVDYMVSKAQ